MLSDFHRLTSALMSKFPLSPTDVKSRRFQDVALPVAAAGPMCLSHELYLQLSTPDYLAQGGGTDQGIPVFCLQSVVEGWRISAAEAHIKCITLVLFM
jgi:hypothetical protein